jgi:hypothetical protein
MASVVDGITCVEHLRNNIDREKLTYLEKKPFVTPHYSPKRHTDWPEIETGPLPTEPWDARILLQKLTVAQPVKNISDCK